MNNFQDLEKKLGDEENNKIRLERELELIMEKKKKLTSIAQSNLDKMK